MTEQPQLTAPRIHLNGTSKQELLEQLEAAYLALSNAILALSKAAPHGRDYYPISDDAIVKATQEHRSRVDRIVSVQMELTQLADAINAQSQ